MTVELPKSGHAGIQLRVKSGMYRARIRIGGKIRELGEYETLEEAVAARAKFVEIMFGERSAA
jgi:hypothetical protein